MLEVCPSFSCFINSLQVRHGRDPAPLPPSLLSLLCFVIAVARRCAKACWERTEEIWRGCGMPDLARGPEPRDGRGISRSPSVDLSCSAACPPRWPLNFAGLLAQPPCPPLSPAAASAFPLRLFFTFVGVFGLTLFCMSMCV